jgi:glycosyltransferase involved in cell wall biosynthesis
MVKEYNPLVSICIPTYNGAKYIEEALHSALNQTYSNIEIIISDDNSQDSTLEIFRRIMSNTQIPFYIYNHIPSGIGANWNNCVKKANGKFIKFLFQDDILFDNCIEMMITLALKGQNVGLVYCKRKILYDSTDLEHHKWIKDCGILHKSWIDFEVKSGIEKGRKYLKNYSLLNEPPNKIGEPPAVLLNKSCFEKVGYFDEELKQTLDFEYWYRVMKYYDIGFIDEELIAFRLHKDQATYVNNKNMTNEYSRLMNNLYRTIFWQLNLNRQWKLFKSQSKTGTIFRYLKRKLV